MFSFLLMSQPHVINGVFYDICLFSEAQIFIWSRFSGAVRGRVFSGVWKLRYGFIDLHNRTYNEE